MRHPTPQFHPRHYPLWIRVFVGAGLAVFSGALAVLAALALTAIIAFFEGWTLFTGMWGI